MNSNISHNKDDGRHHNGNGAVCDDESSAHKVKKEDHKNETSTNGVFEDDVDSNATGAVGGVGTVTEANCIPHLDHVEHEHGM